jgi:hypothetical protein
MVQEGLAAEGETTTQVLPITAIPAAADPLDHLARRAALAARVARVALRSAPLDRTRSGWACITVLAASSAAPEELGGPGAPEAQAGQAAAAAAAAADWVLAAFLFRKVLPHQIIPAAAVVVAEHPAAVVDQEAAGQA